VFDSYSFVDPTCVFLYFQTIILEILAMNILDVVVVSTIQIKKTVKFIVKKHEW
jgi:hypothetical protein